MAITRQQLLQLFTNGKNLSKEIFLIDLRRIDHEVGGGRCA